VLFVIDDTTQGTAGGIRRVMAGIEPSLHEVKASSLGPRLIRPLRSIDWYSGPLTSSFSFVHVGKPVGTAKRAMARRIKHMSMLLGALCIAGTTRINCPSFLRICLPLLLDVGP
jgi:hypothetical protein